MAQAQSLSCFIGGQSIPTEANSTTFEAFINKKNVKVVVIDGRLSQVASSNDGENNQKIKIRCPLIYQNENILDIINRLTQAAGDQGVILTLRNDSGVEYRYENVFVSAGGEVEDKDGRFFDIEFMGNQIVA